jgi:AFG3 family protein
MAYSMVTVYGMNKEIGNISFYDSKQSDYSFNKPYSDATAQRIDQQVKKLLMNAYNRTKNLADETPRTSGGDRERIAGKEILFQSDLERLIGKRPFEKLTTYQEFTNGKD